MRQNYPITSEEMLVDIRDIQETLISLIGYDSNSFDNNVDISGSISTLEDNLNENVSSLLSNRLYNDNPGYGSVYRNSLVLYYARRTVNA